MQRLEKRANPVMMQPQLQSLVQFRILNPELVIYSRRLKATLVLFSLAGGMWMFWFPQSLRMQGRPAYEATKTTQTTTSEHLSHHARSFTHKMDAFELQVTANHLIRKYCVMIITETWLHTLIPDATVRLADRTIHRQDRKIESDAPVPIDVCAAVWDLYQIRLLFLITFLLPIDWISCWWRKPGLMLISLFHLLYSVLITVTV